MKANNNLIIGTGRLFCALFCLFVFFTFFSCTPKAQAATSTYKVTSTSLVVRSKAASSGKKLGTVSKGTKLSVSKKSGSWGKITYKKKTGWVSLKYCTRISTSSTAKSSTSQASLGTAGRLTISSLDCSVALNKGCDQSIVDKKDSAAYFSMNGCTIIADHNYQAFDCLGQVKTGTTCKIRTTNGTQNYKCTKTGTAWNETADLVDDNGRSVLSTNKGKLIMYTCKSYSYLHNGGCWAVTYTVWKKL